MCHIVSFACIAARKKRTHPQTKYRVTKKRRNEMSQLTGLLAALNHSSAVMDASLATVSGNKSS